MLDIAFREWCNIEVCMVCIILVAPFRMSRPGLARTIHIPTIPDFQFARTLTLQSHNLHSRPASARATPLSAKALPQPCRLFTMCTMFIMLCPTWFIPASLMPPLVVLTTFTGIPVASTLPSDPPFHPSTPAAGTPWDRLFRPPCTPCTPCPAHPAGIT